MAAAWHGMFVVYLVCHGTVCGILVFLPLFPFSDCSYTPSLEECCHYNQKGKGISSQRDDCFYGTFAQKMDILILR